VATESPWNFASHTVCLEYVLGNLLYDPVVGHPGSRLWSCDLALVSLDAKSLVPNQLIVRDEESLRNTQSVIRKHDLCTVFDGFPDTWRDVVIMTASRGLVYGVLSEIPARVSLGFDDDSLEVYAVTMNDDNGELAPVRPLNFADANLAH